MQIASAFGAVALLVICALLLYGEYQTSFATPSQATVVPQSTVVAQSHVNAAHQDKTVQVQSTVLKQQDTVVQ